MTEKWFKFTSVGRKDLYGFGTLDEAVMYAEGHHTPYLLSDMQVAEFDLVNRDDAFKIKDALAFIERRPIQEAAADRQIGPERTSAQRMVGGELDKDRLRDAALLQTALSIRGGSRHWSASSGRETQCVNVGPQKEVI